MEVNPVLQVHKNFFIDGLLNHIWLKDNDEVP